MSFIILDRISVLHEGYAASIGRAVVVCQHLESCAHHAMVVYAITDAIRDGVSDHEKLREIAVRLRNLQLGRNIQMLEASGDFARFGDALQIGRSARNWLVHEAADVVEAGYSIQDVLARLGDFRAHVSRLCEADRILSIVSYEICEREPAPSSFSSLYAPRLVEWVMSPIIAAIGALPVDAPSD